MNDRRIRTEDWLLGSGGPAAGCASVALAARLRDQAHRIERGD